MSKFSSSLLYITVLTSLGLQLSPVHGQTASSDSSVSVSTQTPEALKKAADTAISSKDWSQAIQLLDSYLAIRSADFDGHMSRGYSLGQLTRYDEAIVAYTKASKLDPKSSESWNGLCWNQIVANQSLQARPNCQKAVDLRSTNRAALVNLGHTYLLNGDTNTAKTWYQKTIENVSTENQLNGAVGDFNLFIKNGWEIQASTQAKTWFETEGAIWLARQAPANKLLEEAKAAEMQKDYAQSIVLREKRLPLLIDLFGEAHSRVIDARVALNDTLYQNAVSLFNQSKYLEALPLFDRVLSERESPNKINSDANDFVLSYLGSALSAVSQYAKAEPMYIRALAISEKAKGAEHPSTGTSLNNLAELYKDMGQYAKAEPMYIRALAISEKAEGAEHPRTGTRLNNLAGLYRDMGQYVKAEPMYIRALAISEKAEGAEHPSTGTRLDNLAGLYKDMGQYAKAEPMYIRALAISEKAEGAEHPSTGTSLNNLANLYTNMGKYARAEPMFIRALAISEKAKGAEHPRTGTILNNLAGLYKDMGQYAKAEPLYIRALAISEKAEGAEHPGTGTHLNNLAGLYRIMGQYAKVEPMYIRALAISEKANGAEHPRTGTILNNLAKLYKDMGQYAKAEPMYIRALAISEKANGAEHPSTGLSLGNLGELYVSMATKSNAQRFTKMLSDNDTMKFIKIGDSELSAAFFMEILYHANANFKYDTAESMLLRAWQIANASDMPELSWATQNSLRFFYIKDKPSLAIWYGKQAINTLQTVRAGNTALDKETQKSFLQKNESSYKSLADLLFAQGRLMEGQQVLAMLKEFEYFDFLQRNNATDPRQTQSNFTEQERPWSERYGKISSQLASIGKEREQLLKKSKDTNAAGSLSADDQARKDKLDADMAVARQAYAAFMVELKQEFSKSASAERQQEFGEKNLNSLRALQGTLRDLGHGAVTLHYLVTDKRLWILLTTPTIQLKRESTISEAELNKLIGQYREAIANRSPNIKTLGKALYDILLGPVAEDLKQADAKTLMLSLDGSLRYLPMAALYDGEQYLAKRYSLALYTSAAKDKLKDKPQANWTMAGYGLTQKHEGFNALPAVKGELDGIMEGMKGQVKFDNDFTAKAFKAGLESEPSVVHLASHFVFAPGNETDSYLLLGDGKKLSLKEIKDGYEFVNLDLLTLSACETAVGGGKDANGREVEGFGALAQNQGAKGVIATLWPVADQSTGQFMQLLYGYRQQNPGMTKAQAMQKAQLAFIEGKVEPALAAVSRGASKIAAAPAPVTTTDHPYYWAPFILMGNWL